MLGVSSCSSDMEEEIELKKTSYLNIRENSLLYQDLLVSSMWGFEDMCDLYKMERPSTEKKHWVCQMRTDIEDLNEVFKLYQKKIQLTEDLLAYHFDMSYRIVGLTGTLDSFPTHIFKNESSNENLTRDLGKAVAFIDTFYNALTEAFIDAFYVEDPLLLYDLAKRHERKESLKKIDSIYPELPVYVDDQSIYKIMYSLGIVNDYQKMIESVETPYDAMLLLANLDLEINKLAYLMSRHREYQVSYCGPTSRFMKPEIVVDGPAVVGENERFTLQPRMILYDPYMKYEVEFGGVMVDSFQITRDTLIKGELILKKRNGVLARYPFEKEIYIR